MITTEKIRQYLLYKGDPDMWARNKNKNNPEITTDDWLLIDDLMQNLKLIQRGIASRQFIEENYKKLQENCDDKATIQFLEKVFGRV